MEPKNNPLFILRKILRGAKALILSMAGVDLQTRVEKENEKGKT